MNDEREEEYAKELIEESQAFEIAIFLCILKEMKSVFRKEHTPSQSIGIINKMFSESVKSFVSSSKKGIEDTIYRSNGHSYNEMKDNIKNEYDYSDITKKYADDTYRNFKKYIKTKGIAIGDKGPSQFFTVYIEKHADDVVNGRTTIEKAISSAIDELSKNGLKVIEYKTGTKRNIDVWVRQQLVYAQRESTKDIVMNTAKENNITIFEFDAHSDARPSHQLWQGKRFDTTGKYYPTKKELCNDEDSDYGCLHRIYPVYNRNDKMMYTDEQLKNINTNPFSFEGIKYTGYEAKQKARSLERDIRRLKKKKIMMDEEGIDSTDVGNRLRMKNRQYRDFMKAYGTYPRTNRTRVKK